ncbi:MAG: hypothetical protein KAG53_01495 [Endozoicomonadaceae bacterium]|nr:hypothetical protein [Endozoicomonadaceae bacterium]
MDIDNKNKILESKVNEMKVNFMTDRDDMLDDYLSLCVPFALTITIASGIINYYFWEG